MSDAAPKLVEPATPLASSVFLSNQRSTPEKMVQLLSAPPEAVAIESASIASLAKVLESKKRILDDYQERFGSGHADSIITVKKGKMVDNDVPSPALLSVSGGEDIPADVGLGSGQKKGMEETSLRHRRRRRVHMAASLDKYYRVEDLDLYHVLPTIVVNQLTSSGEISGEIKALAAVNRDFALMVPKVVRWSAIDFSPLRAPRLDYESQTAIDPHRIEMASAAMIHFGMHPGKLVRWLGGEYTGQHRDIQRVLDSVKGHISDSDYAHIERILWSGCPAKLNFEEPSASKLRMLRRGNQKSFNDNPILVQKTLNKEDRYSHLLPMDALLCLFSPYVRHTSQGIVIKEGKNDRVVWDGSTKRDPTDTVMNEVTSVADEAEITFGNTKMEFYIDLYNMRISYPTCMILIATSDCKACFRHPRVHPDLTGAFGFLALEMYLLATAMVFGSNTSATSWEPFRRAIEALSAVYANRPDLVEKHAKYIDMVQWSPLVHEKGPFVQAVACSLNKGLRDEAGNFVQPRARVYVDDALMAAFSVWAMKLQLAATIEAIFTVMGEPNIELRQCPLAMDKWEELVIGPRQVILGLVIDTRTLTVGITDKYKEEVTNLINKTWHKGRKRFTVSEAQKLVGKLARLAEGAHWVFHLLSHLYTSIAHALSENTRLLNESSNEFRELVQKIRKGNFNTPCKEQARHLSFTMKQAAKMVHHADFRYNINSSMRQEIEFFREALMPDSGVVWETPIALIVPRMPSATTMGDSSLEGAGGYSIGLGYWWHLDFPDEVVLRTLKHKTGNDDDDLISINVLEFVTVIINYCAAYHIISTTDFTDDPHPVILNVTDNRSALNWTVHTCKQSRIGRLLGRFFCSLLINSPIGINSQWISTKENKIADDISRLKRSKADTSLTSSFDYSLLQQTYPELKACSFFQIEPVVISLIWEIVLTEKWPSHESVQMLKQRPLGRLIT